MWTRKSEPENAPCPIIDAVSLALGLTIAPLFNGMWPLGLPRELTDSWWGGVDIFRQTGEGIW